MATNFKITHTGVGPWRQGDVVSLDQINAAKQLGGLDRLKRLGGIEETDADVTVGAPKGGVESPNLTKGDNVEGNDTVEKRAERRADAVGSANDGTKTSPDVPAGAPVGGANDAAAKEPVKGGPGAVTHVNQPVKRGR